MRRISFLTLLFTFFASSSYAEEGWYVVTQAVQDNTTYSIKLGTGERTQNKQGEPMTVVVGKTAEPRGGRIEVSKWYVTDTDCAREYGHLVVLTVDGAYKFESSFAKGSNSIASGIAETICALTATEQKKAAGKSI